MRQKTLIISGVILWGATFTLGLISIHLQKKICRSSLSHNLAFGGLKQKVKALQAVKLFDGEDDEDNDDDSKKSPDDSYTKKEYEQYFRQKANLTPEEYERLAYEDYYGSAVDRGLIDDIKTVDGVERKSEFEVQLENAMSRKTAIKIVLAAVGLTGVTLIGQRWQILKQYSSIPELTHPLDVRTVRRPITRLQIRQVLEKASKNNYNGLPEAPRVSSIADLQWLTGFPNDFQEEIAENSRVVVYHFWRRSNPDSIQSIQGLENLAEKYPSSLTVVSIHSPKFEGEKTNTSDIFNFIQATVTNGKLNQYMISDANLKVWTDLGLDEYPAILLGVSVQPKVPLLFAAFGERAAFSPFVSDALEEMIGFLKSNREGSVVRRLPLVLKDTNVPETALKLPSGIAVDGKNDRVYIADTGNNRIIISDLQGRIVSILGSKTGKAGLSDGGLTGEVLFDRPQGLALDSESNLLWIADSGNNCLRRLSLLDNKNIVAVKPQKDESESSISGDIMEDFERQFNEKGLKDTSLYGKSRIFRTPVAVTKMDSLTYVTLASSNQVWRVDDEGFRLSPVAGSGKMGVKDYKELDRFERPDALLSDNVRFAQPTGICGIAGKLYVCDAESSSVRQINFLDTSVSTILGGDRVFQNDVSIFGDKDGKEREARFQYPTGLCMKTSIELLLCDTLNHKIKLLTLGDGSRTATKSKTYFGSGNRGLQDGNANLAKFNEPTAVAYDPVHDKAWVCDSMNNEIRICDTSSFSVSTFKLNTKES